MVQLTEGITYGQIKRITDWQLSEEAQRQALAQVVNAISRLDITQAWVKGKRPAATDNAFGSSEGFCSRRTATAFTTTLSNSTSLWLIIMPPSTAP